MLFVARNFEIKGGPDVLEIFHQVRHRIPGARLLVAGSSDPDPGVTGVTWLGPCSHPALERAYPEADVFVYPTRFDCAPLVVMEAMAHRCPGGRSSTFGLPSMVRDGEGGVFFPPGDIPAATRAVERLAYRPSHLARLAAGARDHYERRLSTSVRNEVLRHLPPDRLAERARR